VIPKNKSGQGALIVPHEGKSDEYDFMYLVDKAKKNII
jgi:hypothetical protein